MIKRICFVANYTLTFFFHEIAKNLKDHNIETDWIVVNKKLYDFLSLHYDKSTILYLNKLFCKERNEKVEEFKLNELVYGDRVLRYHPDWAIDFLLNIQQPIYNFILTREINFIFGELTWAHEILIHRMTSLLPELKAKYLCPHTIRIPSGRFTFFEDEFQSQLFKIKASKNYNNIPESLDVIPQKPDYLALNDKLLAQSRSFKARLSRIKRFFSMENFDKNDPTLIENRWLTFKIRAKEEWNKEAYRLVHKIVFNEKIANSNFVFLALHKQPEASIDVIGRYYEDQYLNIVNIWRILPDDWLLIVKEHSNAIGDRSLRFYNQVKKMRNVLIVDERTDSHMLIKNCQLVITVSGTVAYEAALIGKPALTFAPTFFSQLPFCNQVTLEDLRRSRSIFELIRQDSKDKVIAIQNILQNSFEGIISDPLSNPHCMESKNIRNVTNGFLGVY